MAILDDFPQDLKDASAKYGNYTIAFTQLPPAQGNKIQIRMQCPLIFYKFAEDKDSVDFGRDPQGLLFYHTIKDFGVDPTDYVVSYLNFGNPRIVVIDFYEKQDTLHKNAYARWIARIDPKDYSLPHLPGGATGSGRWDPFEALTSQAKIFKLSISAKVRLRFQSLQKQVFFNMDASQGPFTENIKCTGILMAHDISRLTGTTNAICHRDRIVFFPEKDTSPKDVIALFLPKAPLEIARDDQNKNVPVRAVWSKYVLSADPNIQVAPGPSQPVSAEAVAELSITEALAPVAEAPDDLHELADDYHIDGLESAADA